MTAEVRWPAHRGGVVREVEVKFRVQDGGALVAALVTREDGMGWPTFQGLEGAHTEPSVAGSRGPGGDRARG